LPRLWQRVLNHFIGDSKSKENQAENSVN